MMGYTRRVLREGNGVDMPKVGDLVTIKYTGNLYDEASGEDNDFRGKQYAASVPWKKAVIFDLLIYPQVRLVRKARRLCNSHWNRKGHSRYVTTRAPEAGA